MHLELSVVYESMCFEHMCGPQHFYLSSNLCLKSEKSYDKVYPKGPAFISDI